MFASSSKSVAYFHAPQEASESGICFKRISFFDILGWQVENQVEKAHLLLGNQHSILLSPGDQML